MNDITKMTPKGVAWEMNKILIEGRKQRVTVSTIKSLLKKVGIYDGMTVAGHTVRIEVNKIKPYGGSSGYDYYDISFRFDNDWFILYNSFCFYEKHDTTWDCMTLRTLEDSFMNKRTINDMLKKYQRTMNRDYQLTISNKGTVKVQELKRVLHDRHYHNQEIENLKAIIQDKVERINYYSSRLSEDQEHINKLLGK